MKKYSNEVWKNQYFYWFAIVWLLGVNLVNGKLLSFDLISPYFLGQIIGAFLVSLIVFTIRYFIVRKK